MRLWRISRRSHTALDGEGARLAGGRWNRPGVPVVYSSSSLSLAALEVLVHVDPEDAPADLVATEIDLPDGVRVSSVSLKDLPRGWRETPDHHACVAIGDDWIKKRRTVALSVPSAVIPEERNVLLNPRHPDIAQVRIVYRRAFAFEPRLLTSRRPASRRESRPAADLP